MRRTGAAGPGDGDERGAPEPEGAEVVESAVGADQTPLLRVVKGRPTDEELAALVAVLAARGASAATITEARVSGWTDRARLLGAPPRPGPHAWRSP